MKSVIPAGTTFDIVAPGEVYVFTEGSSPEDLAGPVEYMYIICSNEQIGPAVQLELGYPYFYTFIQYLGFEKINERCFCFMALCYDEGGEDVIVLSKYLHRIQTLDKMLAERIAEVEGL